MVALGTVLLPHQVVPVKVVAVPTLKPVPIAPSLLLHREHRCFHSLPEVRRCFNQVADFKAHPGFLPIPDSKIKPLGIAMRIDVVVQNQEIGLAHGTPVGQQEVARLKVATELQVVC